MRRGRQRLWDQAMVNRYTSPPLELPDAEQPFERADLIFYGLDHAGDTFEARVFVNAPKRLDQSAGRDHPDYIGSFFIFGHGGCFGDEGHCDVPAERDPFDFRLPHQLEPAVRILTVTDVVQELVEAGADTAKVTVIAETLGERPNDVLAFDTVRLATYA
jgi:tyrosinase